MEIFVIDIHRGKKKPTKTEGEAARSEGTGVEWGKMRRRRRNGSKRGKDEKGCGRLSTILRYGQIKLCPQLFGLFRVHLLQVLQALEER